MIAIARRRIPLLTEGEGEYVDLGLPSGILWAKGNIVKDAQGNYSMGSETDRGCRFSWGNIDGHNLVYNPYNGNYQPDDGYTFDTNTYSNTPGAQLTASISSTDAQHDAAFAYLGSPWHIPTVDDCQELYDNTTRQNVTIDGVKGWKFMKKTDNSIYIFLPFGEDNKGGSYNSSTYVNANTTYAMLLNNKVQPKFANAKFYGCQMRAVRSA